MLEWLKHQMSYNENHQLLDGQFNRNSKGLNISIEETIAMLKKEMTPKESPLNITGQLQTHHNKVVEEQLVAVKNKSPFEEKVFLYCLNDTKDEKYKEYGQKMQNYDDFKLRSIEIEKKYLAHSPVYYLEKLNNSRNV